MAALIVPPPQSVLSQDLIAQFTDDDAAKIQVAVAGNVQLWLIWSAMLAQRDPMVASNAPSSRMGGAGTGARTTPHEHDRHRARPYHRGREPINSSDRRASALERITDSSWKSRQFRFVRVDFACPRYGRFTPTSGRPRSRHVSNVLLPDIADGCIGSSPISESSQCPE